MAAITSSLSSGLMSTSRSLCCIFDSDPTFLFFCQVLLRRVSFDLVHSVLNCFLSLNASRLRLCIVCIRQSMDCVLQLKNEGSVCSLVIQLLNIELLLSWISGSFVLSLTCEVAVRWWWWWSLISSSSPYFNILQNSPLYFVNHEMVYLIIVSAVSGTPGKCGGLCVQTVSHR